MPISNITRRGLLTAGGLLIAIASHVLAGWWMGELTYVQIQAGCLPVHYNAALGILLWGLGIVALATNRTRIATIVGWSLVAWAVLFIVALAADFSGTFEGWLFPMQSHFPRVARGGVTHWGCAIFVLGGLGLWVLSKPFRSNTDRIVSASLGITILFIALLGFFDLHFGARHKVSECPAILMIVTAFLGGFATLMPSLRSKETRLGLARATPGFVWAIGMGVTFVLWYALEAQQSQRIRRMVQADASQAHQLASEAIGKAFQPLDGLAEKVRTSNGDIVGIRDDAGSYIGGQPGTMGVGFVNSGNELQWIESRQGFWLPNSIEALGVAEPISAAVRDGTPVTVRAPRSYWQGKWTMISYVPIDIRKADAGGLLAVISLQLFLESILNLNVAPDYAVEIRSGTERLYGRLENETGQRAEYEERFQIAANGLDWQFNVWPTESALKRESLWIPRLALIVGFLMVTLLAVAVHLAQTSRIRAGALEIEIKDRVSAETALRRSEGKYRSLIENLEQGVFLKGADGSYLAVNTSYCRRLGKTESEIVGHKDDSFASSEAVARWDEQEHEVLRTGKTIETEEETMLGNEKRIIRRVLSPLREEEGQPLGVLGIIWDVTEQRALDAKVRQSGKMDALGQLAGGIAHDFNNLLTAVVGNLDLIRTALPEGDRNRELAISALGAATRATSLTGRLLGFARQHHLDRVPTDITVIVDEVVELLRRTIDPRIRIETDMPESWHVEADPAQLNQVLMNLCLNARDAIRGVGCIRIETRNVELSEGEANRHDGHAGEYVRLRLSDDGDGMTPEVQARIFEPFFTTKEVGKGTGLGLALVFGIVKHHRGWVECHSEVGKGTRFDIYLPRTESMVTPVNRTRVEVTPKIGKETILIADDEPGVRRLTAAVLRRQGYEVLEAENGQEAVEVYALEQHRIDLALLDLTMPVVSGQDAFRQMLIINPQVRVMFTSGYAAEELSEEESRLIAGFVKKPFLPQELVVQVQHALEESRKRGTKSKSVCMTPKPISA